MANGEVKTPRTSVDIRDFRGMATNADPTDIQPGVSRLQVNVNGLKRGRLEVRRGLKKISFDES